VLITGRTIYHFHTRTKTGRVPQLQAAAPDVWVECSPGDAHRHGLAEGDLAEVTTARRSVRARVRVSGIRDGVIFLPFHYGYWDTTAGTGPTGSHGPGRAANELTPTDWNPVSKHVVKTAAARLTRLEPGDGPAPAPTVAASRPVTGRVPPTRGGPTAHTDELLPEGVR
jgi:anaerobic selenocysteine-containing dehydrogenase